MNSENSGKLIDFFQYPKDPAIRAVSLLGGASVFQTEPDTPLGWVSTIRRGFPAEALDSLGKNIQATTTELALLLGISVHMLAQRRRKGLLSQHESERLFRVARVLARAEEVWGDVETAFRWLNSPIIVLRGAMPLSLLDTEVGGELIMETLGRIEYGISA